MLVDRVVITISAGRGGDGVVSWRREKAVSRGGPDGGDGGRGGDVLLRVDHNLLDLHHFRHRRDFRAEDGSRGGNKKKHGRSGADLILGLPVGTEISTLDGTILADLVKEGADSRVARGGTGGKGNWHFADATHQNPQSATRGQSGESKKIILQLKLLGDWAVVGLPNAGKSSLIQSLTGVQLPIGPFRFSTREPFPAVLDRSGTRLVLIDLPGLIEGAHLGRGLGDQFLKHTDRVRGLIYVADAEDQPQKALETTTNELTLFRQGLVNQPRVVVLSKIDKVLQSVREQLMKQFPQAFLISNQTGEGIDRLKNRLME